MRKTLLPVAGALVGLMVLPTNALAVTVSSAQLSGGSLRLDGAQAAPGQFVTVESASSSAGARADTSGAYHVTATNFRSDDCKAVVRDGRTFTATVTLAGCTPTPATPQPASAPTGNCTIIPRAAATVHLGDMATYFVTTNGCATSTGPVQWSLTGGHLPTGMTGPTFQGQTAGSVGGRPTVQGSYSFKLQVKDSAGQTDEEIFGITVDAARPVAVTTAGLPAAAAGRSYQVNLSADGGLPGYLWTVRAGTLPAGLRLTTWGALAGTPTARGTFTFTVGATDSQQSTGERAYTLTVT